MSYDGHNDIVTKDLFKLWAIGDAYWIVKLAFHPEMARYFYSAGR
jgi:hypothetical protein